MKKNRFWFTYDFGVQGDYGPLYAWLDDVDAKDCGDSVATFKLEGTREEVSKTITKVIGMSGRMYLIGKNRDGIVTGGFISGRRKAPPWTGSSNKMAQDQEEEA
jgi:hypothetical protein